jgi:hypothetical protein
MNLLLFQFISSKPTSLITSDAVSPTRHSLLSGFQLLLLFSA